MVAANMSKIWGPHDLVTSKEINEMKASPSKKPRLSYQGKITEVSVIEAKFHTSFRPEFTKFESVAINTGYNISKLHFGI